MGILRGHIYGVRHPKGRASKAKGKLGNLQVKAEELGATWQVEPDPLSWREGLRTCFILERQRPRGRSGFPTSIHSAAFQKDQLVLLLLTENWPHDSVLRTEAGEQDRGSLGACSQLLLSPTALGTLPSAQNSSPLLELYSIWNFSWGMEGKHKIPGPLPPTKSSLKPLTFSLSLTIVTALALTDINFMGSPEDDVT